MDSFATGTAPRTVALDLVGRINPVTKKRQGGLIGLANNQKQWADSAYEELRSTSPKMLRKYLSRKARNKRYDPLVRRALKEGRPLKVEEARKLVGAYRNNLLRLRGEAIARTELLRSLNAAQDEGLQQLVDDGKLQADQIARIWDASEDLDTRDSHSHMEGDRRQLGEAFTTGNGHQMRHPGDASLGAPAEEIINCRCRLIVDISFLRKD